MNKIFAAKKSKFSAFVLAAGIVGLSGCGGGGGGPTPPPSAKEQIVFESDRDGNTEIYIMDIDGANQRRLTNNPAFDSSPTLNAATKRVVFESRRVIGGTGIYSIGTDGEGEKPLVGRESVDSSPSFSRDGSKIVLSSTRSGGTFSGGSMYIISAEGKVLKRVDPGQTVTYLGSPSFHPNGRSLIYVDIPADGSGGPIYNVGIDGIGVKQLTTDDSTDGSPHYSPDGSKIVFTRTLFESGVQNPEIFVMNADGSNPVRLTRNAGRDDSPSFTADGSKIVFSSRRDGNGEIYIMNADGTNPTRLTNNATEDDLPSTS